MTSLYMTKYERARILGTRALQIRSVPAQPNELELTGLSAADADSRATLRPRQHERPCTGADHDRV